MGETEGFFFRDLIYDWRDGKGNREKDLFRDDQWVFFCRCVYTCVCVCVWREV